MKKVITRKSAFSSSRLLACLLCLLGLLLALFAFSGPFSTNLWPREQEIPMAALSGLARLIITTSPHHYATCLP